MSGVVAAGAPDTAAAGAEILRRGGNAVDAAIAASLASFVAEPILASPGGAGVMTLALPGAEPAAIDFFSDMPGLGGSSLGREFDFRAIEIDFGPVRQEFHIGRGSAAVPGVLPGLAEAHRQFGAIALDEVVAPAVRLGREGSRVTERALRVFRLIWPILAVDPETTRAVTNNTRVPRAGEWLRNPELADVLEEFAASGRTPDRMIEGLLDWFGPARGGLITEADVTSFEPRVSRTRSESLGDWTVCLPPVPGGQLAQIILRALAAGTSAGNEADEVLRFARASAAGHAERHRASALGSTTHVSVVDSKGGAASVTLTNGEGCGYVIPGTGIQVNNFLGEEDLNPGGFHRHQPGRRLPTMMSPGVALRAGVPALALGSGGSNRIRSAVSEVLYRFVVRGQSLDDAVAGLRVHAEDETVWFEGEGLVDPRAVLARLAREFRNVHIFEQRDFFFGGVNTVYLDENGKAHGVGDARRGGAAVGV
ncbi:MAG: gamma-glutamyltransferase [Myxococcota bacterium]